MCYAFTYKMLCETETMAEKAVTASGDAGARPAPLIEQLSGSPVRKRSASTTLERSPAKVAKIGSGGERSREGSVATVATQSSQSGGKEREEDTVKGLRKKLNEEREAHKTFKSKAIAKYTELQAERDEAETAFAQKQIDFEAVLKSRGKEGAKDLNKKITENLNKKQDRKIRELREKHQETVADLKERTEQAEAVAKDTKAEFAEKEKERKREHTELKRQLKADQQAEIKKHKAENSGEVKGSREKLKTKDKEIQHNEDLVKQKDEQISKLLHDNHRLRLQREGMVERIRNHEENAKKTQDFAKEYAADKASLEARLHHEGQRWEKLNELHDEAKGNLAQQQRTIFQLRNANESKIDKLKKVMAEMKRLRGMAPVGEVAGGSGEVGRVGGQSAEATNVDNEVKSEGGEPGAMTQQTETSVPGAETGQSTDVVMTSTEPVKKAHALVPEALTTQDDAASAIAEEHEVRINRGPTSERADSPFEQQQENASDHAMADGAEYTEQALFGPKATAEALGVEGVDGGQQQDVAMTGADVDAAIASAGGHVSGLRGVLAEACEE